MDVPVSSNANAKGKAQNRRVEIEASTWDDFLLSALKSKIPSRKLVFSNQNGLVDEETHISVCKDAFVDSFGVTVNGDIELFYQEYRKPSEFIALNKSLQFHRNQQLHYFQSGGMYWLKATHRGMPVFLDKECLEVNFKPTDSLPYERYVFEETSQWVRMDAGLDVVGDGTEKFVNAADEHPAVETHAEAAQKSETQEDKSTEAMCELTCKQWLSLLLEMHARSQGDELIFSHQKSLEERFKSLEYQGAMHYSKLKRWVSKDSVFGVSTSVEKQTKRHAYFSIAVNGMVNQRVTPQTQYAFRMERDDFANRISGRKFSDYRIETASTGFLLVFKDSAEFCEVPVIAYDLGKWFKKRSKKKHARILSAYNQNLSTLDSLFQHYRGNDSIPCILTALATFIPQAEKALETEDWLDLVECNRTSYARLLQPVYDARSTFCAGSGGGGGLGDYLLHSSTKKPAGRFGLGLYNYDIEHQFKKQRHVLRDAYQDENSKWIVVKKTFLYSSKNNALITIDAHDFWLEDEGKSCLIFFDESGKLYTVSNAGISNGQAKCIGDKNISLAELEAQIFQALDE